LSRRLISNQSAVIKTYRIGKRGRAPGFMAREPRVDDRLYQNISA
jgi:hypothetical protein